ncbi:hypothetical protein [Staphylococcus sp. S59]|nr:hypothetical protein [Staphylococcus sp. S59]
MAKKTKINRISNTINFIGIAVEGFNWYAYQSKIKNYYTRAWLLQVWVQS